MSLDLAPRPASSSGSRSQPSGSAPSALQLLGVAAVYFCAAKFGMSLAFATKQVTAIWPPTGVAFVALLLLGRRAWPGVYLGAFAANATAGEPLLTAAGIAAGNTLASVLGVVLAERIGKFSSKLNRLSDVLALAVLASALACVVSATLGVTNLVLAGLVSLQKFWSVWQVWWLGDALGVLLVSPFILAWLAPAPWPRGRRLGELTVLAVSLVVTSEVVLSGGFVSIGQQLRLAYSVFPFVIWAAVRFGLREVSTAAVIVCGYAVWGTIHGRGPFAVGTLDERLLLLDTFVATVALTALTLSAVVAERRQAQLALEAAKNELEVRVVERTEELRHEQARLAEAQRIAQLGSWEWDTAADVVRWSDELFRIHGRDKATFGGSYQDFLDCIHPDDRESYDALVRAAFQSREPFQSVYRILRGGEVRFVESRASMVLSSSGEVRRMMGTAQDVTEREHQQARLRESDAFFELSLDMLSTATVDGYFRRVNPAFKMLGYSEQEILETPFLNFVHPDDVATTLAEVGKLSEGIKTLAFENRYRCKDGSYKWISWVSSPDKNGILYGTGRDVTEQKQAEAERAALTEQLQVVNTSLKRSLAEREVMLQEIHHRVKNNLQVISSLLNLQMRKLEAGENRDALQECRTRVEAIALIHEKLYQSKDYAHVSFAEYARGLTASVFDTVSEARSRVRLELAVDDIPLTVDQAIPCGLILNELITNALKHGFSDGRAGTVRVEFSRADAGRVRLAVFNDGIPLPEGIPHERTPSLGLQLVSTLSDQLQAELEVLREGGTTFQLKFGVPASAPA